MVHRPFSRLLLDGLLVGFLPAAAVMGSLIAVFGASRPRGHNMGGMEVAFYLMFAALVWLIGTIVVSVRRPWVVVGFAQALSRGVALGLGGLLVLLAVQLGWGSSRPFDDLGRLAETTLLPGLAMLIGTGLVSAVIWALARRRTGPAVVPDRQPVVLWGSSRTVFNGLLSSVVALGVLILGLGVWSAIGTSVVTGWWILLACLLPGLFVLALGIGLFHAQLRDRARARLYGASHALGCAVQVLIWYRIEAIAPDTKVLASLTFGLIILGLAVSLGSGRWWSFHALSESEARV